MLVFHLASYEHSDPFLSFPSVDKKKRMLAYSYSFSSIPLLTFLLHSSPQKKGVPSVDGRRAQGQPRDHQERQREEGMGGVCRRFQHGFVFLCWLLLLSLT